MGKASRLKALKHSKKIRVRSDQEIAEIVLAYRNLYKSDPFLANMMLLCSELSEYFEIPMTDEKKLSAFIKENSDGLLLQFLRRFKAVDECAIPGLFDSPGDIESRSVPAGWAGGIGRA